MIKFYFVEGISRFDTLYFETIEDQETFFEDKLVGEMEDSYYPPHYRNEISVGSDDLDFNSKVNYLSLEFKDKTYYYFIDNINYVAEDLITLSVTMDTIQTYMFNITFKNIDVSRRLINRWVPKTILGLTTYNINRNYLRENLSEGVFYRVDYQDYTQNYYNNGGLGLVVFKWNNDGDWNDQPRATYIRQKDYSGNPNVYMDDSFISVFPAVVYRDTTSNWLYTGINIISTQTNGDTIYEVYKQSGGWAACLHAMAENADVVEAYYIPENIFSNSSLDITNDNTTNIKTINTYYQEYTGNDIKGIKYRNLSDGTNPANPCILDVFTGEVNYKDEDYTLDFNVNTQLNKEWSFNYLPQLIDENYIQLYYGERVKQTSLPLSLLEKTSLKFISDYDIFSGYRNHYILEIGANTDKYLTKITLNTNESFTLWTDAWKQYQATHKGTLGLGLAYQFGKTAFDIVSITKGKGFLTPKRNQVSAKAKRAIKGELTEGAETLLDTAVDVANKIFTPETLSQGNQFTNDVVSGALHRICYLNYVKDIEEVGKQLEGYGYKVHEHYANQNIFNLLNTRYYFNIIQCDYIDIYINILNSNEILDNIKERFTDGIRLWNNNNIGNPYQYDNVEKEYLEEE